MFIQEILRSEQQVKFEVIYIDDSHPVWIKKEFKLMLGYKMKKWISYF